MNDGETVGERGALLLSIGAALARTYGFLTGAKCVMATLGESGNKVLLRIMGLIVMRIAVEFFFAGLRPIVRTFLEAP